MTQDRRRRTLWLAIVAGQAAWLIDMEAGYLLVYAACASGSRRALTATTAAALIVAIGGLWICWRTWRATTRALPAGAHAAASTSAPAADAQQPDALLALGGAALNLLATLVIVGMAIPRAVLDPCR